MHHKDFEPSARYLVTTGHPITRGCTIGVVAPGFYILPHGIFLLWHHVSYRFSMSPCCYPVVFDHPGLLCNDLHVALRSR